MGSWRVGGSMAEGYHPTEGAARGTRWFDPLVAQIFGQQPGQGPQQQRHRAGHRPPPDPHAEAAAQLAAARRRARQILGFAATEPITEAAIKVRYRKLAQIHHPDKGGSLEKMTELNAAADILYAELAG